MAKGNQNKSDNIKSDVTLYEKEKYVIFHVEGGLGKNIAATAVFPSIKQKYPDRKLIVVCSWPEVMLTNPHIDRAYRLGNNAYFYDQYIKDGNAIVMRREPYFEQSHINQKLPLHETWHNMYDLPFEKGKPMPQLAMNYVQKDVIPRFLLNSQKPVLLIHTNGGPMMDNQPIYSWTRDIPMELSKAIVDHYKNQFTIVQICKAQQQVIQGVDHAVFNKMSNFELFNYLRLSSKRVLIDSCLQHAAAAYNLPSTVLWVGTHPEMFGYKIHSNIKSKEPSGNTKLIDSLYFDFDLSGQTHQCPYTSAQEMFDLAELKNAIDKT